LIAIPLEMNNMYEKIARYYDLIHADLSADVDYILRLAKEASGPILELGCGSGRILFPLARGGHAVTGIDNSDAMLSLARGRLAAETRNTQERVRIVEANAESFRLAEEEESYGLAVISYNTLMHLNPRATKRAFQRIAAYLAPSGRLFIDLINPSHVSQSPNEGELTLERCLTDEDSGETILHMSSTRIHPMKQTMDVTWVFDASPLGGGLVQRTVAQVEYYYHYPHQIDLLLKEAGLTLLSTAGDYDGAPFAEESERLLLLAMKQ